MEEEGEIDTINSSRTLPQVSYFSFSTSLPRTRTQSLFGDNRFCLGAPFSAACLSHPTLFAGFHSTQRNQGSPFLVLTALLKVRKFLCVSKVSLSFKLKLKLWQIKDFNRLRTGTDCNSNSINFHSTRLDQVSQGYDGNDTDYDKCFGLQLQRQSTFHFFQYDTSFCFSLCVIACECPSRHNAHVVTLSGVRGTLNK